MSSLSTYPHRSFIPMFYQETPKLQQVINSLMPEVEKLTLSVFPNPTKGAFTIQVKDALNTQKSLNGNIVLRDFLGREIYKISIVDALECTISISQRPAGLYFLNYMDSKQEQFSQQILLLP